MRIAGCTKPQPFSLQATVGYVFYGSGNTVSMGFSREIAAAHEEAVDRVAGVSGGGIVEFCVVGGKVTREISEGGLIGAIGGESRVFGQTW
jgi:hypothetical protein